MGERERDAQPQPTPDAVLDWIADRINARPWPIEGGYPVRMQGIDDGTADLDLLPAGFDPEEDWEDPPEPVARYRITVSPRGPLPEPIPFEQLPGARQEQIQARLREVVADYETHGFLPPDEADRLRAQVVELTERAETAEEIAQARDELLGEWLPRVERAAELETTLAAQETAINFETTCLCCGAALDAALSATHRADAAEAQVQHWRSAAGQRRADEERQRERADAAETRVADLEAERDEAWGTANHNNERAVVAEVARLRADERADIMQRDLADWADRAAAAEKTMRRVRAAIDSRPCHCPAAWRIGHQTGCPSITVPVDVVRRALESATNQPSAQATTEQGITNVQQAAAELEARAARLRAVGTPSAGSEAYGMAVVLIGVQKALNPGSTEALDLDAAGMPAPEPDPVDDPLIADLAAHLRGEGWGRSEDEAAAIAAVVIGWLDRQAMLDPDLTHPVWDGATIPDTEGDSRG